MTERDRLVNFLKSVRSATEGYDFIPQEDLDKLPNGAAARIEELEDLLSRLSLEAEAMLWHVGLGPELYPELKKKWGL